jgi:putative addiction module component (TIGR02574 family)
MTATLEREVRKLCQAEKIQLAKDLWDDVVNAMDDLPVPESHKGLLDERLAAHLATPGSTITLDQFRQRLAARL